MAVRADGILATVTSPQLSDLETYYDAAPRPSATVEEVGPFTVFCKTDPEGWDYYARPRLELDAPVTAADVAQVRDRQRALGVPESLEWVHETTPTLLAACREDGLHVEECPLLVLPSGPAPSLSPVGPAPSVGRVDVRVELLAADSATLPHVIGAVHAGFSGVDDVEPGRVGRRGEQMRDGLLAMAGAYDGQGTVLGGGSHSPRGATTELTGIAVVPGARRHGVGGAITAALVEDAKRRGVETIFLGAQDDAVARVYERVGFVRVGTACIAAPS